MAKKKKGQSQNGEHPVRGTTTRLDEAAQRARLDEAEEMSPGDILKKIETNQRIGRAIKDARDKNEGLEQDILTARKELKAVQTETKNLESQLKNREAELSALQEIEGRFTAKLKSSFAEQSKDAVSEALNSAEANKALRKNEELSAEKTQLTSRVEELTAVRDKLQQKVGSC